MTTNRGLARICALVAVLALLVPAMVLAQGTTTGNLGGTVADDNGAPLPGVQVTAIHVPTGTKYMTFTRDDGRFLIQNVRAGGPYTVTADLQGFNSPRREGIQVRLGEEMNVSLKMQISGVEEAITVTGETPLISPGRTGATSSMAQEPLETLPTVQRSIYDVARVSPYFSTDAADGGISVAGRNNRYNNIQIDGAVNNDVFGLSTSGTPGGGAETQPISLDAIQELQLVTSDYDVRKGSFTGGAINAITKSGTNEWHGSVFYYTRDDSFVGELNDREIATFEADQYGLSLGGPIMKDRAFFFANGELNRREAPTGFSADGTSGVDFCANSDPAKVEACRAEVARFQSILATIYGYDAGSASEFSRVTDSDNYFGRLDFNLTQSNQLTLRHNFVDATNDRLFPSSTTYDFPSMNYAFPSETNSTVLQWNSVIGNDSFNELRVTYQTIREKRQPGGDPFPQVQVTLASITNLRLRAGTEGFSGANELDQDIIEVNDDFSFTVGNHTFTLGTHNEFFSFRNVFIRDIYGNYTFRNLDAFERGWADSYAHSYSRTDDPRQAAEFDVQQFGLYAGDQWAVSPNVMLTLGVRVDAPFFPDTPNRNPDTEVLYGLRTDTTPDGNLMWSPRLGFNWDLAGDGKQQIKGGLGIFAGRTPYVWISNQYSNTGIEFNRLTARASGNEGSHIDFVSDPYGQPTTVPGGTAATNEVNLIDPDFEMPQVLRATLGYDRDLGLWGLVGSVEGTWTDILQEVKYQDVNLVPDLDANGNQKVAFDGRPLYKKLPKPTGYTGQTYSNAVYLTNTDQGYSYTLAARLEKPFSNNWYASVGYVYNQAEAANEGTSSQAISNWRFHENDGDPNNVEASISDFEMEHRINAAVSYAFDLGPTRSSVGLYFNRQSGRPYSTTFFYGGSNNPTINGDFETGNDLVYVPASAEEVEIVNGTWEQLDAYIQADEGLREHRGEIVPRNASRAPYVSTLDLHYGIQVPVFKTDVELTFDILNLLNLIDEDKGIVRYAANNAVGAFGYEGINPATGKPKYRLGNAVTDPTRKFTTNDLASRWQAKVGARISF